MADQKLTDKTVATSTGSGDKYHVVQGGTSKQIDYDSIEFKGNRVDLSGGTILDWDNIIPDFFDTLVANRTFTDVNLPQGTKTKVITLSLTGEFAFTFPSYWVWFGGEYDGTKKNTIIVFCKNGNVGSEDVRYTIQTEV